MNSMSLSQIFLFHFSALFILASLLCLCQCGVVQSDAELIEKTCSQTPFPDLCISSLKSSPKSATADVAGLGLIMVDLLKAKTSTVADVIKQLIRTKPEQAKPLSACAHVYDTILTADIPEATQALSFGNYKFAEQGANDAALEANSCEAGFARGQSPLTKVNKDVQDSSAVLAAIAHQLL